MAKSPKKAAGKPGKTKSFKLPKFSKTSLIALSADVLVPASVQVDFKSGIGQLTAVLFRNGVLINMQSISTSGVIQFSEVQSQDTIAVNGVCTGDATVKVSVPTNPGTPENFSKQIIMSGYTIL
jgi:hypothetical protein